MLQKAQGLAQGLEGIRVSERLGLRVKLSVSSEMPDNSETKKFFNFSRLIFSLKYTCVFNKR